MGDNSGIYPRTSMENANLLPKTLTVFQILFIVQILVGVLSVIIALPLGINDGSGFVFYILGFVGYLISVVLLISASIFLTINAKRIEGKVLDARKKKSSTILACTIAIALVLVGANIVYAVEYNLFHAIEAVTVFGTANVISALLLAIEINIFENMLKQATGFTAETKGYQFLRIKPLIITATLLVIAFIIATPIYFSTTGETFSRQVFIEMFIYGGNSAVGLVGSIVIYYMKNKWITDFKKRAVILSKN